MNLPGNWTARQRQALVEDLRPQAKELAQDENFQSTLHLLGLLEKSETSIEDLAMLALMVAVMLELGKEDE